MNGLRILGTGRCLPASVVTNDDMSLRVDTSDEWIASRTGIRERRFCREETGVQLAAVAARRAMEQAGITADQVGLCVVATFTPDYLTPSTACLVQQALGLPRDIPAFDLNAACSGFVYGLAVIRGMLSSLTRPYALLIGAEVLSRVLDFTDRSTCVLFGDGAGAAVLARDEGRLLAIRLGADGQREPLYCPGPGRGESLLRMDGRAVFRFAVEAVPRCIGELLADTGLTLDQVDAVVCHQANARIISHVIRQLKADPAKFYLNVHKYGNTSAASIPIALDEMAEEGRLRPGMKVLCVGFGAGYTWGGALLEW